MVKNAQTTPVPPAATVTPVPTAIPTPPITPVEPPKGVVKTGDSPYYLYGLAIAVLLFAAGSFILRKRKKDE